MTNVLVIITLALSKKRAQRNKENIYQDQAADPAVIQYNSKH